MIDCTPFVETLGGKAVAVAAGSSHTLVAMTDGKAFAFGNGGVGRLGSGSTDNIGDTPQTLPHLMGPVSLGGNAVVGVDLDYEVIGDTGSMLMVSASGTAVKI